MAGERGYRWRPAGATVRGAAHARRGLPNEDAFQLSEPGPVAGIAVADGHGDRRVPRAALGARYAAELAVATLTGALGRWKPPDPHALAEQLLGSWRERVLRDFAGRPLTDAECAVAGEPDSDDRAIWLYGTTLLAAAADQHRLIACQIGDGELGLVYDEGELQLPVGRAESAGRYTASMALPRAGDHLKLAVVNLAMAGEVLVWACTDGFSGAQADPDWRTVVARQLSAHRREHGVDDLAARLPEWLRPAAESSGDDTTMALLVRGT
jgi:hypothetical protein